MSVCYVALRFLLCQWRLFGKPIKGAWGKSDVKLMVMNGEDDHVHLLIEYAPNLQLSTLVNSLKGVSSRLLRKDRPDIAERYYKDVLWSPSYFAASCGGAPLSAIKQYVEQQRTPTT